MGHVHILMLYIAGCEGLAVLAVYYVYSLSHPSDVLRSFLRFESGIFAICVLNIFHSYIITDLGAPPLMQELYYAFSVGVSIFFLYYMGDLSMALAGQVVLPVVRRAYAGFCVALGSLLVIPFFRFRDLETILVRQKWIDSYIVTLVMGIAIVVYAAFVLRKLWNGGYRTHRIMALTVFVMNGFLTSYYVFTVIRSPTPGFDEEGAYLMATDNFFFFWNLLALLYFFRLASHPDGKRGATKKTVDSISTRRIPEIEGREWRLIEGAVIRDRLFLEPGLDLPELSRATGLPRNRISRLVADVTGKSFSDWLNSLRIAEFGKIVIAPGFSGNILAGAFEAGFNSKANFYNCIKKQTGLNPGEFIKQVRADPDRTCIGSISLSKS